MKRFNRIVFLLLISFIFFIACSKVESFAPASRSAEAEKKISVRGFGTQLHAETVPAVVERKLVKEGHVGFKTDSIKETTPKIRKMIDKYKGFVSHEEANNYSGNKSFTLVARIPVDSFDKFIEELEKTAGSFDNRTIGIKDITSQFVDTEARLKAKKEVEKSYLAILEKAKTINETLAVQKLLGEIRGEIESVEGQLKLMQSQTSLSTVTISYYENKESVFSFVKDIGRAFVGGWEGFLHILIAATYAWVFIILGIVIFVIIKMRKKKKK